MCRIGTTSFHKAMKYFNRKKRNKYILKNEFKGKYFLLLFETKYSISVPKYLKKMFTILLPLKRNTSYKII